MKITQILALGLLISNLSFASENFFGLQTKGNDGKEVSLKQYQGKVVLAVNTASKCGFTPQYESLETLYKKYKDRGFVVLGFPSNDFGGQEPGTNAEIKKFCELKYRVTFPLMNKDAVKGPEKQSIYKFLTEKGPKETQGEIGWNFTKFLIDQNGQVVGRWDSKTLPTSDEITAKIENLLKSKI